MVLESIEAGHSSYLCYNVCEYLLLHKTTHARSVWVTQWFCPSPSFGVVSAGKKRFVPWEGICHNLS